jgi:hypothetical protein
MYDVLSGGLTVIRYQRTRPRVSLWIAAVVTNPIVPSYGRRHAFSKVSVFFHSNVIFCWLLCAFTFHFFNQAYGDWLVCHARGGGGGPKPPRNKKQDVWVFDTFDTSAAPPPPTTPKWKPWTRCSWWYPGSPPSPH